MDIIRYPDDRLRKVCVPVERMDRKTMKEVGVLLAALKDMDSPLSFVTGLAANQLGFDCRIIILKHRRKSFITMINPVVISTRFPSVSLDLCASIPWTLRVRKRYLSTTVRYLDLESETKTMTFFGSASFTLQQELDHLDGKLIID